MRRNRLILVIVLGLVALGTASPVLAQSVEDINFQDILNALAPRGGQAIMFDILLYMIFFLGLVNNFMIPDKQILPAMLNFGVIGLAIVSKLLVEVQNDGGAVNPSAILEPGDLPVLIINVGIFVLPLLIAGSLRAVKGKRSNALFPAIVMGLLGGAYFFLFWALEQRGLSEVPQPGDDMQDQTGMLMIGIVLGWQAIRGRFRR